MERPAVSAPSAASTSTWLSGANPLFRLPGNAPFPQQPQTPTLCPSPCPCPGVRFPQCPPAKPTPCLLPSFRKSADSFSVTLASKKRIALRRNILSLAESLPVALASPASSAKRFGAAAPSPCPCPGVRFPPCRPTTESAGSLPPPLMLPEARLKNSRVGRCRSSAPAPVCPARAGGKSGKTPLTHFPMPQKPQKKDGPRKKRRPSECSAAETANTCRKPTCWASACSDKFHALRTCSLDTCPWSCRARCGRRGSDAPADRRWKDQRTDLRFHPA